MKKLLRHSSQILHNRFPHNLRIDLGGRNIAVSQEFLNGRYTHPLVNQLVGIGVAGCMEGEMLSDARYFSDSLQIIVYTRIGFQAEETLPISFVLS